MALLWLGAAASGRPSSSSPAAYYYDRAPPLQAAASKPANRENFSNTYSLRSLKATSELLKSSYLSPKPSERATTCVYGTKMDELSPTRQAKEASQKKRGSSNKTLRSATEVTHSTQSCFKWPLELQSRTTSARRLLSLSGAPAASAPSLNWSSSLSFFRVAPVG
jgi:hypothetical protein